MSWEIFHNAFSCLQCIEWHVFKSTDLASLGNIVSWLQNQFYISMKFISKSSIFLWSTVHCTHSRCELASLCITSKTLCRNTSACIVEPFLFIKFWTRPKAKLSYYHFTHFQRRNAIPPALLLHPSLHTSQISCPLCGLYLIGKLHVNGTVIADEIWVSQAVTRRSSTGHFASGSSRNWRQALTTSLDAYSIQLRDKYSYHRPWTRLYTTLFLMSLIFYNPLHCTFKDGDVNKPLLRIHTTIQHILHTLRLILYAPWNEKELFYPIGFLCVHMTTTSR